MEHIFEMDYEELENLDEAERSYYEDALSSGNPDEIRAMLAYFGLD